MKTFERRIKMNKMNKPILSSFAKYFTSGAKKHAPEILTGFGIAGMITTTVLAVKATPKALLLMEEKKKEVETDKLTPVETVKTTYKCYIPAAVTGAASVACLIGASSVNLKRNAALAAAYTLSETSLKTYQEKVIETVGKKKEKEVRDAVAKGEIEKNPLANSEVIITEKGNTLCYDAISGRYFKSDIDKLKKIENELNYRMREEMYISLNDFYYELGLSPLSKIGDDLGWNIQEGYLELDFSSQLADDGTPCLVVDYGCGPRYDYRLLM